MINSKSTQSVRQALAAEIERIQPDLVVIGTHGRTGIGSALLGSVTTHLLQDPPIDVLAMRAW